MPALFELKAKVLKKETVKGKKWNMHRRHANGKERNTCASKGS